LDHSIVVDCLADKLDDFQYEIQTDIDGFLKIHLGSLYRAYKQNGFDMEALKEELLQLVAPLQYPNPSSIAYADAWTDHLCTPLSICVSDWCRSLLHYLYTDFEQSELLQWIAHRFQMPVDELLKTTDSISALAWLKLWMTHRYPNILSFLFGMSQHKKYRSWGKMDLKKVICYLPVFMLCQLDEVIPLALDLAKGKNVRQSRHCPYPFNKKMTHYFTNAPIGLTITEATWYGIIAGLKGDTRLVSIFSSFYNEINRPLSFLQPIIRILSQGPPSTDDHELRQLLAYLQHLWDEQAELRIKGWTFASLVRRSNEWQQEMSMRRYRGHFHQSWSGAAYAPYLAEGEKYTYRIVQLTSSSALFQEGKDMRHCVGGYFHKCSNQGTSIWSLRQYTDEKYKRLVTIEVSSHHQIVQARKRLNAMPEKAHLDLIRKWAQREGLSFARSI
jgi:hypothetical protein